MFNIYIYITVCIDMLMYFNQMEIYIINVDPGCWFQIKISGLSIFFKWLLRTMRARCSRHAPGHDRRRTLGMDQNLSAMGPIRSMILVLFFLTTNHWTY